MSEPDHPTALRVLGAIGTDMRQAADSLQIISERQERMEAAAAQDRERTGKALSGINLRHLITTVVMTVFTITSIWLLVVVLGQSQSNGEGVHAAKKTLAAIEDCLNPHGRCAKLSKQQRADDRRQLITSICRLFSTDPDAVSRCVARAIDGTKAGT